MKGYVNIPNTIYVKRCKDCGARPIIAMVEQGEYVVKCPISDNHFHTQPGLIDLDAWNNHNKNPETPGYTIGALSVV
jgi:hypothetical protein